MLNTRIVSLCRIHPQRAPPALAGAKFSRAFNRSCLAGCSGGAPLILEAGESLDNRYVAPASEQEVCAKAVKDLADAVPEPPAEASCNNSRRISRFAAQTAPRTLTS
ncbi:MAG: hypothetical protein LBC81_02520 [Tannerellaceae bacterium]|nr:hypothetical protein [Tannerellaceae bacterium]